MGAVDTTYTFTATDTITSTKMNNIIDQTTITSDAIIGTTLEVASGKLKIRSAGITSNELATNAITTTAINDGAVTPAKLSTAGPSWDNAGGTLTLSQRAVELGNGITADSTSYIDFHSSFPIIDNDARIIRDSGINGVLTISNQGTGAIVTSASGGVTFGSANMPVPSGTAPIFGVRSAGTFLFQSSSRTLNANSLNTASVTRIDSTSTSVTFTTALPNANYSVVATYNDNTGYTSVIRAFNKTTAGFSLDHQTEGTGRTMGFIVVG